MAFLASLEEVGARSKIASPVATSFILSIHIYFAVVTHVERDIGKVGNERRCKFGDFAVADDNLALECFVEILDDAYRVLSAGKFVALDRGGADMYVVDLYVSIAQCARRRHFQPAVCRTK